MKYTAKDILKRAGLKDTEEVFGKVSVNIGGVVANDPAKVINVQKEETIDIVVAGEKKTAKDLQNPTEEEQKNLKEVRRAAGKKQTQKFVDQQKQKGRIKEEKKEDTPKEE